MLVGEQAHVRKRFNQIVVARGHSIPFQFRDSQGIMEILSANNLKSNADKTTAAGRGQLARFTESRLAFVIKSSNDVVNPEW